MLEQHFLSRVLGMNSSLFRLQLYEQNIVYYVWFFNRVFLFYKMNEIPCLADSFEWNFKTRIEFSVKPASRRDREQHGAKDSTFLSKLCPGIPSQVSNPPASFPHPLFSQVPRPLFSAPPPHPSSFKKCNLSLSNFGNASSHYFPEMKHALN